ncbi:DegT/DnrJ/EryC1/StrS aminotransferase family protein [Prochlorococcus sp. MIT 1223]|uniref:DegT/DnrJ/EryC1/StrS family aminotransferase n=1 Tax=Prochlorococcus sp. MIT 1223 TaxID=3096217 RepID=UPI002A74EF39|nr:DegT/DnrJ/EryC1/StrS aminotransferase family protein [Prochlorococcus sp. MIT 1223]
MNLPYWPEFDSSQINAAVKVLNSGKVNKWTGNETENFEKEFASFCGTKYAIALANGSIALSAALKALGIGDGDEVITTPRSFIATASSIVLEGAQPVFADIDKDSGCITANSIEPLINHATKAILVVHLAGWPADMLSICKLAKSKNIFVIEDCAQAHGAEIGSKSVGSFGDISAWSFCQDKIISTAGEGGMITTDRRDLWEKVWSLKDHGKSLNSLKQSKALKTYAYKFMHESFGYNFRLTELQSAIGRIQLRMLSKWNEIRTRNALILFKYLESIPSIRIALPKKDLKHAYYKVYVYLEKRYLKDNWNRERIMHEINSQGFPAFSGTCSEIYLEDCFKKNSKYGFQVLPNAKLLGETSLMFLVHPTINEIHMNKYSEIIRSVLLNSIK